MVAHRSTTRSDRALFINNMTFLAAVERRHELVLGFEWNRIEPRQFVMSIAVQHTRLFRRDD